MAEEKRKEWLAERRKGIGGSDSPRILGVSPWGDARQVALEKLDLAGEGFDSPAMKRGRYLEPIVAQLVEEQTKYVTTVEPGIIRDPVEPWMCGSIDRWAERDGDDGIGILEIKCPGLAVFKKIQREGLPDYMQIQLQHYLRISNSSWGVFAIFNSELWQLVHFEVKRDDSLIDMIVTECGEFWQALQEGVIPEEKARPVMDLPPIGGEVIVRADSISWRRAIEELREAQEIKAEAEALEEDVKNTIRDLMAGGTIAENEAVRIYNRIQNGKTSWDIKKLQGDFPTIEWEKYKKVGKPFRTLRPYWLKERRSE